MKNLNTQQTEVIDSTDWKPETENFKLHKSGLHSFTHFDAKASNGAKIKEINSKVTREISTEIDPLTTDDEAKNVHDDLWETNHALITKAIHELMRNLGRVPTKKEIAIKTGLSRQTVHSHLKGFAMHPLFKDNEEQFQILSSNVMAKVYEFAMLGDPRAARLYFEITGKLS